MCMIVVLAVGCSTKFSYFFAVTTMMGDDRLEPTGDTGGAVIRPAAEAIKDTMEVCLPC